MKINFLKMAGGTLIPADDDEVESMKRFKNGEYVIADIKLNHNYKFLQKAFVLTKKAFDYWSADKTIHKYKTEKKQFESFRDDITIKAGYYDAVYALDGSMKLVAKSWSYENMPPEEFDQFYQALWQAIADNVVDVDTMDHWMMGF